MINESHFVPRAQVESELEKTDGIWLGATRQRVLLQVSAKVAGFFRRRNLIPNQQLEKETSDGDILVSSTVAHSDEILPIIRYWIPHVRILEPTAYQDLLEHSLAIYLKQVALSDTSFSEEE